MHGCICIVVCVCVCVCVCKDYGVNCHLQKSCTRAGCDLSTSELDPLLLGGTGVNRHVTSMPLPRPDVHRINITLYFEDTGAWGEWGDNALWSNILIIPLSSLSPPLHPFARPRACSLSHSLPLTPSPSHTTPPPLLFWTEVWVRS